MSLGNFGNGSTFKLGASDTVSELISIGLPEMSADDIDITTHNDPDRIREFIKGLTDPGEVAIEGNMSYDEYAILYAAMTTTSLYSLTITLPTSPSVTTFAGNCYVKSLGGTSPHDEKIDMSASVKITGKPILTEG
jgi:predicted secreted protein